MLRVCPRGFTLFNVTLVLLNLSIGLTLNLSLFSALRRARETRVLELPSEDVGVIMVGPGA